MGGEATTPCANCQRLQAQGAVLTATVADLQAAVAQLQAQLASARKNSSTSSKPPSSDIVKPPKPQPPPGQDHCQRGGQPGHPKHERPLLAPELLTAPPHDYVPEMCPDCGRGLRPAGDDVRVVQQVEIAEVPILIEEHRSHPGWCAHCCKVHYAPLPAAVASGGLAGPRLTTLIAVVPQGAAEVCGNAGHVPDRHPGVLRLPDFDGPAGRDEQQDPDDAAASVRLPRPGVFQAEDLCSPRGQVRFNRMNQKN